MARLSRWVVALATVVAMSFLVAGCSPTGESTSAPSTDSRKASSLGSRLCIENATSQSIPLIRERGPFVNGDHLSDGEAELKPESFWCTSGYNSYRENTRQDATAEISFASDGSDTVYWGVYNNLFDTPRITWGNPANGFHRYSEMLAGRTYELTYPQDSEPKHSYRIERVKDSTMFKEWRLTILN